MVDPRFLPGDRVFVHAGPLAGASGRLLSVDERTRTARFSGTRGSSQIRDGVRFEQLCLESPARRPLEEDVAVAVRSSLAEASAEAARRFWLSEAARSSTPPDDPSLAAALARAEAERARRDEDAEARVAEIMAALEAEWAPLERAARVARWKQEFARLAPPRPPRRSPAELARELLVTDELDALEQDLASEGRRAPARLEVALKERGEWLEREAAALERRALEAEKRLARVRATPPRFLREPPPGPFDPRAPLPDESVDRAIRAALGGRRGPLSADDLAKVTDLEIVAVRAPDLSALAALPALRSLSIECGAPVDLSPLAGLEALRVLLVRAPIEGGLGELARCPGLRRLGLWGAPEGALAHAARCSKLDWLVLRGSSESDLSPLSGHRHLRGLDVSRGLFADLSPLSSLPLLEELWVEGCPVRDLAPLARAARLSTLRLEGCPVEALEPLLGCSALGRVALGPHRASGAEALSKRGVAVDGQAGRAPLDLLSGLPTDPAGMIAQLEAWGEEGFSPERHPTECALRIAALASGDERAMRQVAVHAHKMPPGLGSSLRGLVLRDGRLLEPFAPNPFGLPPSPDVAREVARIWAPLEARAPGFVRALSEETLGLLLTEDPMGDMVLGYLIVWQQDRYESHQSGLAFAPPRRVDLASLGDWIGRGSLTAIRARPPLSPVPERVAVAGLVEPMPLPLALRELYAVHAGLESGLERLEGPSSLYSLMRFREEKVGLFESRNEGRLPWHFVQVRDNGGGDGEVLDLGELDGRGDPQVRFFDHETWRVGERSLPFWAWFEQAAPACLLKHAEDESFVYHGASLRHG